MPAVASRVLDVGLEDGGLRNPIRGLFKDLSPPTLADALTPLCSRYPNLHPTTGQLVEIAREHAEDAKLVHPSLSLDECTAVVIYTMEDVPREDSPYFAMNATLRERDREQVRPWVPFIWLLLHGLHKLPPSPVMTVIRGDKRTPLELGVDVPNKKIQWSAFSSTAATVDVMNSFLGGVGPRTMLQIELTEPVGRDVRDFSLFPSENEVLLPPNCRFQVVGSAFAAGGGLEIVQLKQIKSLDPILDFTSAAGGGGGAESSAVAQAQAATQVSEAAQQVQQAQQELAQAQAHIAQLEQEKQDHALAVQLQQQMQVHPSWQPHTPSGNPKPSDAVSSFLLEAILCPLSHPPTLHLLPTSYS